MRARVFTAVTLTALAVAGCADATIGPDEEAHAASVAELLDCEAWQLERMRRQADIDLHVLGDPVGFQAFAYDAMGNSGVPVVVFKLFQDIFPDIWGAPGEGYGKVGLAPEPYVAGRSLPFGLSYAPSTTTVPVPVLGDRAINVVQLTCVACHAGRVVGPDGGVRTLLGAPSTEFNQFRVAVARTVADPRYTAANFRAALASKPSVGWLYGANPTMVIQEQVERSAFMREGVAEQFLDKLKDRASTMAIRSAATLDICTYGPHPNAPDRSGPKPGSIDAIGAGITLIADPAVLGDAVCDVMPDAPAEVDPMSVWAQADRPMAQWDGSIVSPVHRQLASAFAIVGSAGAIDLNVAVRTTDFTRHLPAAPYPFDVVTESAARGKLLYDASCAGCHAPGNAYIFTPAQVGTDPNRASIWSTYALNTLGGILRAACTNANACGGPDLPDHEILQNTGGYVSPPLAGIWARAPYLHNGSVPTLYHLLVPGTRPAVFYRGDIHYDQEKVGFRWNQPGTNVHAFDTTRAGLSNAGHDTPEFLGAVDWAKEPGKLADLLEYLKTL